MPDTILIIDDEEPLRKLLARILTLEKYVVLEAGTIKNAWEVLSHKLVDVILCDVKLPDGNGVDFIKEAKAKYPIPEIILLTAYGNIPDGVQAIKNGAFDYLTKGNDNDRIIPLLQQALQKVARQKKEAIKISENSPYSFEQIIGTGNAITEAVQLAKKIAPANANVLLLGETGTGKEIFANAIHAASKRAGHAFVAINCSAFTKDLLENELFGHKAGAFTGAAKDKEGLIELADGGTLFLDEIGELNIELQSKLLRVLESGTFIKLGDTKITRVDVRIIAATNRDLVKRIAEGAFREDLYYRLNVFAIHLPALRNRTEDIPQMVKYFMDSYAVSEGKMVTAISNEALQLLQNHLWKGNIRELKNVMERAVILADDTIIYPKQLPFEIQHTGQPAANSLALADIEKQHIEKVLQHTKNNKTKTAELLGIGLTTLYRKIDEYKLQ